jgi:UDP-N-acetylmuramyl pentapeptide phosphotransferase/UDP-N-acetylglucosamine-1-phosphate transferase
MPFVFIIAGIVLLVSGVRGQSSNLLTLVKGDLTGSNNFIYWIVSILVIGSIGYIDDLKSLSRAFLVLVIVVLVLNEDKNGVGGFFTSFQSAITSITKGVS